LFRVVWGSVGEGLACVVIVCAGTEDARFVDWVGQLRRLVRGMRRTMCGYGTDSFVPLHGEDIEDVISVLVATLSESVKLIPKILSDVFVRDVRATVWRMFSAFFLVE
jgi:hypothetical protein